jgi:hypothetical protein
MMKIRHRIKLLGLLIVLALLPTVSAQTGTETPEPEDNSCPAIVQRALMITRDNCDNTGRNQICYGHRALEAQLRSDLPDFEFQNPGDILDAVEFESVSLSALDTLAGVWGVLLMEIQTSLQMEGLDDVTFIVFGDASLESAARLLPVTAAHTVNIRSNPSTESSIVGGLTTGERIVASGRTEDSEWLRVQVPQIGAMGTGWVLASLLTTDSRDLETLDVVSPQEVESAANPALSFGPMEAFYFRSGIDDAPCEEAPNSGLLIQTPEGEASVSIWIDEVIVELSATAFVQADAGGNLTLNVLDGLAQVTADGDTRTAIAGTQINVPINEELGAAGVPESPQPYQSDQLQSLPVDLLRREFELADPLNLQEGIPAEGRWRFTWGVEQLTCPDGSVVPFESTGQPSQIRVEDEGGTLIWAEMGTYIRGEAAVYTRAFIDLDGNLHQDTLTVVALDRINGEKIVDFAATDCTLTVPFQLQLVSID